MSRQVIRKPGIFLLCILSLMLSTVVRAEAPVPSITGEATGQLRPGKVVWADLLTSDVAVAAEFYRQVFGWEMESLPGDDYVTARLGNTPVAAIATYQEAAPEGVAQWLLSFAVMDVDKAVARAVDSGARQIEAAFDLPDRGRLAVISDPQGAVFVLLRAADGDPQDLPPADNTLVWAELWTKDIPGAIAFYENLFGYRAIEIRGNAGREIHVLGRDEKARGTIIASPYANVEPNWLPYFLVDDVRETVKKVDEHGGKIYLAPKRDQLNYDIAIVADPTGGVFALQQRRGDES